MPPVRCIIDNSPILCLNPLLIWLLRKLQTSLVGFQRDEYRAGGEVVHFYILLSIIASSRAWAGALSIINVGLSIPCAEHTLINSFIHSLKLSALKEPLCVVKRSISESLIGPINCKLAPFE